jgi:hypothetical protein
MYEATNQKEESTADYAAIGGCEHSQYRWTVVLEYSPVAANAVGQRAGRCSWLRSRSTWLVDVDVNAADWTCIGPAWVDVVIGLGMNLRVEG